MTELEAFSAINAAILAGLPTGLSESNISWPGVYIDPPNTGKWMRVTVQHTGSRQLSLGPAGGSRSYRRSGFVLLNIFEDGQGGSTYSLLGTAVPLKNLFEGLTISGIRFSDVRVEEQTPNTDGTLQVNVVGLFQYDEFR